METASRVNGLAFGRDGGTLIAAMEDATVVIWNLEDTANPTVQQTLARHNKPATAVASCPTADCFATGSTDATVLFWEMNATGTGELIGTHDAGGPVTVMGFSTDGSRLFAGTSDNNSLLVWNVETKTEPVSVTLAHDIKGHSRRITGACFPAGSNRIDSVSEDGKYLVWDLDRCKPYVVMAGIPDASRMAYAEDGRTLLIADRRGNMHRWDLDPRHEPEMVVPPKEFRTRAFSAEGTIHAGVSADGRVAVWNARSGTVRTSSLRITREDEPFMAISGDGSTVAWMDEEGVRVWNQKKNTVRHPDVGKEHLPDYARELHLPALSMNGDTLAVTGTELNHFSELWDISSEQTDRVWPEPASGWGPERGAAFSADGRLVAIGSYRNDVRVHDAATGELLHLMKGHTKSLETLAFSRDGNRLASIGADHKLCIWNPETGGLLSTLEAHQKRAVAIVWSPGGDSIASLGEDGTIKVWTAAGAKETDNSPEHLAIGLDRLRESARNAVSQRNWSKAAADFRRIIDHTSDAEVTPELALDWMNAAAMLVAARDTAGYDRVGREMLERFAKPGAPETAERVAKACLILPVAGLLPGAMELAERSVADPMPDWLVPYARVTRGLADYRSGDFQNAKAAAEAGLDRSTGGFVGALGNLVLAMSEHQRGNIPEATAALDRAREILEALSAEFTGGNPGQDWHDWIFCQALLREAHALIESGEASLEPAGK